MSTSLRSPLSLRAADLMSADVVLLPAEMSLQAAARLLYRMQISGAPVVDDTGHCVGVLSTTDFMHCMETDVKPTAKTGTCSHMHCPWEIPEEGTTDTTSRVKDIMTHNPVTVSAGTILPELARVMLEAQAAGISLQRPVDVAPASSAQTSGCS
jgi:CBS domain-containing protein